MGHLDDGTSINYNTITFWKIIIALYLFNRVSEDLIGSPLKKQVAQIIQ